MSRRRKTGGKYYDNWYNHYRRQLYELALTVFKWENLPPTVSERWIEKQLIDSGKILFYHSELIGYTALQVVRAGELDETFTPTSYNVVAPNLPEETSKTFTPKNSVVIYNNYMRTGNLTSIEMFAQDLAEVKATRRVNLQAQKTPRVWETDDKKKLSAINVASDIDQYEQTIVVNKDLDLGRVKSIETPTVYIADKLDLQLESIWNEAMTFLGINNANHRKKERVQSAEVEANDSQVVNSMLAMLKARREACKEINELFNLNISVVPRETDYSDERAEVEEEQEDNDIETKFDWNTIMKGGNK